MSIGEFINDAIFLLAQKRFNTAMCLAMDALDATAKREYPALIGNDKVGERCRQFIRDHYDVITIVGFGGAIAALPGSTLRLPDPETGATTNFEQILYKFVRSFLTHEAQLPANSFFNEQGIFGKTSTGYSIPFAMVYGVILAVVGAETNGGERIETDLAVLVGKQQIRLADYWGQKTKMISLLMPPAPENAQ